ncbi:MAG: hypothetical protein R3190_14960 [Thermoanaerobaculia bacterium]|nr:hypothetical protein [Thermoanaerobaculia bacterium]
MRRSAIVTTLVLTAACGAGGGDREPPRAAGEEGRRAAVARPVETETPPEVAEGSLEATIDGKPVRLTRLLAKDNYVLATNFGFGGFTAPEGGAEIRLIGMHQTIPTGGPFPMTLRTGTADEAFMARHRKYLEEGGERPMVEKMALLYVDEAGAKYFSDVELVVESFDRGKVVATFEATLAPAKSGDPIHVTGGRLEVAVTTPVAGRLVERATVGGEQG